MKSYSKLLLLILLFTMVGCNDGFTIYYSNGQKHSEHDLSENKLDGRSTRWYDNGQKESEGQFKDGYADGLWNYWYKNGQKQLEGHRKDGALVSASVWKPDGKPCPLSHIIDGAGIIVYYDEIGKKQKEVKYKNGKREGLCTTWSPKGHKWIETHYKNDLKDGIETYYHENGKKKVEGHFKNGEIIDFQEF